MTINRSKTSWRVFGEALIAVSVVMLWLAAPSLAAELHALDASVVSFARPIRAKVQALGLGATVRITTAPRHKHYHGYITRIDEDSFEVTDRATLSPSTLKYWMVGQVAGRQLPDPDKHTRKPGVTALFTAVSRFGFGP